MSEQPSLFGDATETTMKASLLNAAHIGHRIEVAGNWRTITGLQHHDNTITIHGTDSNGVAECRIPLDYPVKVAT